MYLLYYCIYKFIINETKEISISEEAEESLLDKLLKEKAQLKNKDFTKWNQFEKTPPSKPPEESEHPLAEELMIVELARVAFDELPPPEALDLFCFRLFVKPVKRR